MVFKAVPLSLIVRHRAATACWKKAGWAFGRFCRANAAISAELLHLLAKIRGEADRPALRNWRVHELADSREDGGEPKQLRKLLDVLHLLA